MSSDEPAALEAGLQVIDRHSLINFKEPAICKVLSSLEYQGRGRI